jgi:hypothetical protein
MMYIYTSIQHKIQIIQPYLSNRNTRSAVVHARILYSPAMSELPGGISIGTDVAMSNFYTKQGAIPATR